MDDRRAQPHLERAFTPATLSSAVADEFGVHGPVQTVSTGCTSGLDAVGYAYHAVAEGRVDVCLAGAADSPISPITMACFDAIKATSPNNDDPAHASRPFDAERNGFVMGEGAAVLVLEDLEHARARGADVYCEISGYATFGNAYHMTGPTKEGLEIRGPSTPRWTWRSWTGPPSTTSTPTAPAPSRTTGTRPRRQTLAGRARPRHR